MTAVTAPSTPIARAWRVVRLLNASPWTTIAFPLVVMGVIFVLNWLIWLIVLANVTAQHGETADGIQYNGAASFLFVYMLVVAVQAVNRTFPLALGFGSTRRAFSAGSALAFVLLSAGFATLMLLGAMAEEATGGWGLGGPFFRSAVFETDAGWLAQWWIYLCWFLFFFATGIAFAAVYVRWRSTGLTIALGLLGLLVVGAIALVTFSRGWGVVGEALVTLGTLGLASVLLLPALLAAGLGYLLLGRATPRS